MKKGFTLIELLGVIIIVGLISLVAFPPIINQVKKAKSDISDVTLKLIYAATEQYIEANAAHYPMTEGRSYCIYLRDLVATGRLKEPIMDPSTNTTISLERAVEVKVKSKNKADYKLLDTGTCNGAVVGKNPSMLKSGHVTTGDGIYLDGSNYYYRGTDPKNYVRFNNEEWRIVSIDVNNQMKLIRTESSNTLWHNGDTMSEYNHSTIQNHLNNAYYNGIDANTKKAISLSTWNYGAVNDTDVGLVGIRTRESQNTVQNYVGLLSISEYIGASTNASCIANRSATDNTCYIQNWLAPSSHEWLLNFVKQNDTLYHAINTASGVNLVEYKKDEVHAYRIVVVLKGQVNFTGAGTKNDPYVVYLP